MARRFKKITIWLIGGALLLIFFIFNPFQIKFLESIQSSYIFSFLGPFQRAAIEGQRFADGIFSGARFRQKAAELQERVEKMTYDNTRLNALERENEELKKILQYTKDKESPKALAKIFRSGTIFSSDFIINKGKRDNIKVDDFVVSPGGALVGRVIQVLEASAKVMIITDSRFRIAAVSQSASANDLTAMRPEGIIEGAHGTSLKLKFIPQSDKIAAGDIIATRPKADNPSLIFPIGAIRRVETSARDLFQEASVDPLVRFFDFDTVMVY